MVTVLLNDHLNTELHSAVREYSDSRSPKSAKCSNFCLISLGQPPAMPHSRKESTTALQAEWLSPRTFGWSPPKLHQQGLPAKDQGSLGPRCVTPYTPWRHQSCSQARPPPQEHLHPPQGARLNQDQGGFLWWQSRITEHGGECPGNRTTCTTVLHRSFCCICHFSLYKVPY